ncbi:MAG: peroxiredoxin-like family protein [Alphaproteobacteria bacterium]
MPTLPGTPAPELSLPLTIGTRWTLSAQRPDFMTMIVFYRGLHCPICKTYLNSLQKLLPDFRALGINPIAVSSDPEDRARETSETWDIPDIPVGFDFPTDQAGAWGLFVSEAISEKETRLFVEPGLFTVRPDGTLYYASIQTQPFGRPAFADMLRALTFIKERDYPPRGTVAVQA